MLAMGRACLAAAFAGAMAASTVLFAHEQESSIAARISAAVVRVLSVDEAESESPCGCEWLSETGALMTQEGHIVTGAALASRTTSIVAILADGRRYAGKLVGSDSFSNLALFKLAGSDHERAPRAITDDVRPADTVYAVIATSNGTRQSVRARVLEAKRLAPSRSFPIGPYIEIEDDQPEMPVRGPIFNERGKLIGFVTLQTSPARKTQLAFALPINHLKWIADELRISGRVRRSRMGVDVRQVPADQALARGLAEPVGALVDAVSARSPAQWAGLGAGDIILRLAGYPIKNAEDYLVVMGQISAGTRITLELLDRRGARRNVHLTTGEIVTGPPVGQPASEERKLLAPQDR
jgi:serine protease Do